MIVKIGVVSDLHCHSLKGNSSKRDSYLLSDEDLPIFQDPFKSLEYLIQNGENLDVDVLVMPGDFANKACPDGLVKGFSIINSISKLMNAKYLVSNVGNHDVDSRNTYGNDPLKNFKKEVDNFPLNLPLLENNFWDKGYFIIEDEFFRFLVINTSHNHLEPANTDHGDISHETLKFLEDELKSLKDDKIGIAVTHHCPIEHSHYNSGIKDFMHNGDALSALIDKYNFKLLIHGHKHDPRIRQMPGGINSPFIFSSGSFSAVHDKLLLGGCNTFHIISLNLDGNEKGKGKIETWFFSTAKGWSKEIKNQYFEANVGFGAFVDINQLAENIVSLIKTKKNNIIDWDELEKNIPDINYLIPVDLEKLKTKLDQLKIKTSPFEIGSPIFLQYKS